MNVKQSLLMTQEDKILMIRGFKNIKYVFRGKKLGRGSAVLRD